MNELDVTKQMGVSISQSSKDFRLYNLVSNLTISNPGIKAISSKASPGSRTVRFFWSENLRFLKRGVKICLMAPMSPLHSPTAPLSSHL